MNFIYSIVQALYIYSVGAMITKYCRRSPHRLQASDISSFHKSSIWPFSMAKTHIFRILDRWIIKKCTFSNHSTMWFTRNNNITSMTFYYRTNNKLLITFRLYVYVENNQESNSKISARRRASQHSNTYWTRNERTRFL